MFMLSYIVNFYQIPDSILLDFGFDLEKDRFN
ncbi:hypothetical protein GvMRE_Ic3g31 [endosymbiont GvMRE of Glomus versiforme]|nr:hypothetical protein GvMRE_Ic3g31 [endosymbiont GvMRE of Glomus versiforme]